MKSITLDIILAPSSTFLYIIYHGYLYYKICRHPLKTVIGFNHVTRQAWVDSVMEKQKDILAVQSLRNHIMASSLLATTAVILATTLAGFATNTDKWAGVSSIALNIQASSSDLGISDGGNSNFIEKNLLLYKFFALITSFLASFFCYSQSIRLYNHANFLINIPLTKSTHLLSKAYVAGVLAKASNFYTVGTRIFYYAMLLMMWLFGPIVLIIATFLFLLVIFKVDAISSIEERLGFQSRASLHHQQQEAEAEEAEEEEKGQSQINIYSTSASQSPLTLDPHHRV